MGVYLYGRLPVLVRELLHVLPRVLPLLRREGHREALFPPALLIRVRDRVRVRVRVGLRLRLRLRLRDRGRGRGRVYLLVEAEGVPPRARRRVALPVHQVRLQQR